jgi:hypothetical protein
MGATLFSFCIGPEAIALCELGVPVMAFGFVGRLIPGVPISHQVIESNVRTYRANFIPTLTAACPMTAPSPRALRLLRTEPAYADAAAIAASADALLPGQHVSALVVLAAEHALPGFAATGSFCLSDFGGFPAGAPAEATAAVGSLTGRAIAIVFGAAATGLALPALHFLIAAFRHLEATDFVQTSHTRCLAGSAPCIVSDVIALMEGGAHWPPPRTRCRRPLTRLCSPLPTAFEADVLRQAGATHVVVGTTRGLRLLADGARDGDVADR